MMIETFGRHVKGKVVKIPTIVLTTSVPEKVYEIHIETYGVPSAEDAVGLLVEKLYEEFKAKVVWAEVDNEMIKIQLIGSPFAWAALIPFIPVILGVLGISVVLVAVYAVFAAIPKWAYALIAVGVALIFVGPIVGRMFVPSEEVGT